MKGKILKVTIVAAFALIAGTGIKGYGDKFFEDNNLEDATFSTYIEIPDDEIEKIEDKYNITFEKEYFTNINEDDYIFDSEDENIILKDLKEANFVGKIKDVGKGAKKRLEKGLPQEYLYVFKYPCELRRRDADDSGIVKEKLIIYIKINNRKIPYKKVFIVSFHKNRVK